MCHSVQQLAISVAYETAEMQCKSMLQGCIQADPRRQASMPAPDNGVGSYCQEKEKVMQLAYVAILSLIAMINMGPASAQGALEQSSQADEGRTTGASLDRVTKCAIGRWPICNVNASFARGLIQTGLTPGFPDNARCRDIDEEYAISYTQKRDREAYHGGIDMPAPFGTPIIAAAAGTVVAKYEGLSSQRGIEIVLRHSPEDTGFPLWIYTGYGHCAEMPSLTVGQRVQMGDTLCPTGNSGIQISRAKHARRPAIHFSVSYSSSNQYADVRNTIIPVDGHWMDPVALYRSSLPLDSVSMKALPQAEKKIPIAVMFENGETFPIKTKIVWPYRCTRI
jgi:murein DD-endopeptidase MepM/ murein hydrolase activator NlpD